MSDGAYLRFPHIHGDLICFVAEDDVWVAPLDGGPGPGSGRAWRVTADRARVGPPRISPDGRTIAFTSWRSLDPEIHLAPVDGGPVRRLTYWGSPDARVRGWTRDGDAVLAVSSHGQPFSHYAHAYRAPTEGGPGERLSWGPVSDIAMRSPGTLLLTGTPPHEPASWKRYRGGATGRLWLVGQSGPDDERRLPNLGGHLEAPMFVGERIAFLSDHEGIGNLYSCLPDGSGLRRHTDHADFYARAAATDGSRVVYQCAGELWIVDDLSAAPEAGARRLDVRLGGPRTGRRPYQIRAAEHLDGLACGLTGRASAACVRGSLYWLTHREGPARTLVDEPGVRVRLPEMLGSTGRVAYVTDAEGEDAIEIAELPGVRGAPDAGGGRPRIGAGQLGRVHELVSSPDGGTLAVASHDGRLLLVSTEGLWDEEPPPDGTVRDPAAPEAARPRGATATAEPDTEAGTGTDAGRGATGTGPGTGTDADSGTGADTGADADSGATSTGPGTDDGGAATDAGTGTAPGPGPGAAPGARTGTAAVPGEAGHADRKEQTGQAGQGQDPETAQDGRTAQERAAARESAAVPNGPAGRVSEVIQSINGPVRDLAFSPDSGWLAWSHPGVGRSLRQIRIARLTRGDDPGDPADRTITDVTNGRFEDEQPVFTDDGRYLAFLSWRGFDPVYDVHTGDLSFPLGCRPYLVPLNSATPSPFARPVEGRPVGGGLDPVEDGGGEGPVAVETEGLPSRVTPFPVPASKYSSLSPVRGGVVWQRWPISGALGETFANPADPSPRPALEYFDLGHARRTELVAHMDWYAVSGDGTRLVVYDEGELTVVPATEAPEPDSTVFVDMRRVMHQADPAAEWRGAYEEAGRIVRDYFWVPDMCGVDWPAVLDQYRPLVDRVASPDEFADLLREVLGELGTSHAYTAPARRSEGPPQYARPMGLLGADFRAERDGTWTVGRILPGESSDSRARSPLAGTGVREGAALTHVDGRPVDPVAGPYRLLAGAGGTTVELTFAPEGGGPPRRVAVVPLIDERPLRYHDWVARRRHTVRELGHGRCGYLHIPDMGGSGWAQFNRDLRMEMAYDTLIVDVRGNAGGYISELVVEKLARRIIGWDHTRHAQPVSYAGDAPRGPVVALADEATASDGDMITAAFRLLGLGPVVGRRTWGGVVGMTGRHRLGDGTVITVPMNAAWFDEYGWAVENHGVDPDVPVQRTPLDWAEGRNTQLAAAVRVALDRLRGHPATAPPDLSARPDRRRPPLPPRA